MSKDLNKYAVIFDMDGVLVDSKDIIKNSFDKVLEKFGVKSLSEHGEHRGKSLAEQMKAIESEHKIEIGISPEEFSNRATRFSMEELKKLKLDSGLKKLLEDLSENNLVLAVATSSFRNRAEEILEIFDIRKYFELLVTVEDVNHVSKPAPDIFLKTADKLEVPPSNCIVIEDAQNGVDAAKAAGMRVIGFTKYHPGETLMGADLVVSNFTDLSVEKVKELLA